MLKSNAFRYVDLLKKSVLNQIYLENELRINYLFSKRSKYWLSRKSKKKEYDILHNIKRFLASEYQSLFEGREVGYHLNHDLQHLVYAHSMIGRKRMDNIQFCLEQIHKNSIAGDVMECGVWNGGSCIFMKGWLDAYGVDKQVWVADSFDGLPLPKRPEEKGLNISKAKFPGIAVELDRVKENFASYDLLDDKVKFLKGWFKDTLPKAPVEKLSLLRLDGDLYDSTYDSLVNLYPKLEQGGYIIIDDYGALEQCKLAVLDYRKEKGISDEIIEIDWTGVYWIKGSNG